MELPDEAALAPTEEHSMAEEEWRPEYNEPTSVEPKSLPQAEVLPKAPSRPEGHNDRPPLILKSNTGRTTYNTTPPQTTRLRLTEVDKLNDTMVYIGPGDRTRNLKCSKWSFAERPRQGENNTSWHDRFRRYLATQPQLKQSLAELKGKTLV